MKADANLFFRRLNYTQDGEENRYGNVPILAVLKPEAFVSTFLALHPKDQRTVLMTFQARYDGSRLAGALAPERPWLENVRGQLVAAADAMPPAGRYRLKSIIERTMGPALGRVTDRPK
jgi:hypothetical protein